MKTDEIARQTGLSQSNVLVRLHRIRDRLRKALTTITPEL
jgi:DNA-directed RNA polymerase specialized sigma24 family protein